MFLIREYMFETENLIFHHKFKEKTLLNHISIGIMMCVLPQQHSYIETYKISERTKLKCA